MRKILSASELLLLADAKSFSHTYLIRVVGECRALLKVPSKAIQILAIYHDGAAFDVYQNDETNEIIINSIM